MIVKPQHLDLPSARGGVPGRFGNAASRFGDTTVRVVEHARHIADLGTRAVRLLRIVAIGAVALPSLFAGLKAATSGNMQALALSAGFGLFLIWRAKGRIAAVLAER